MRMKLYNKTTNKEIKVGLITKTCRGKAVEVLGMTPPHKPSSTGRVYLLEINTQWKQEHFPSVINAEWRVVEPAPRCENCDE